jgi:hypothetical protein
MSNDEGLIIEGRPVKLLLVEGSDDLHVCYQLLTSHEIAAVRGRDAVTADIQILEKVGFTEVLKSLPQEFKVSGLTSLGIVVDADQNLQACWDAVRDRLLRQGYSKVPPQPDPNGTVIRESEKPTVGVWIMPNNQLTGTLEGFCRYLIPDEDRLWGHAERIVQQIIQVQRHFPNNENYEMKAKIHTWLAWQEVPGKPLGVAIRSKFLDARADGAELFVDWVRLVYGLDSA